MLLPVFGSLPGDPYGFGVRKVLQVPVIIGRDWVWEGL